MPTVLRSVYRPTCPQQAFRRSKVKVRGYGGAMGGGKSRAACEEAFDYALDHPGIMIPLFRQEHTSIVRSTKRTLLEQVIPGELLSVCDLKASQGEDWIRFPNGSEIHFAGLSDPVRWYSSEIGAVFFDEAQEMSEDYVVRLITRLRQRCRECTGNGATGCDHMPHTATLTFNPSNPGHWLQNWFIIDAERSEFGFRKERLFPTDADAPIGDCEFFFAKATDNPYLSASYITETLGGLPRQQRRRLLEGLWEFTTGLSFFDEEALRHYQQASIDGAPLFDGRTEGSVETDAVWRTRGGEKPKSPVKVVAGGGPLAVFHRPVKESVDDAGRKIPGHRYVMGIDASSGTSRDSSAIQVVDVEDWSVAARFKGKVSPAELAEEAYRLGRVYNNALAVPEVTGGWGFTVEQELKRFRYPNLYTRRIVDRLTKKWTDRTGWDTTVRMRRHALETLDRVLSEQEFELLDLVTVNELATFVINDNGKPEAQPGCNDDLVLALAIAVTVASDMPRRVVRLRNDEYRPLSSVTGY